MNTFDWNRFVRVFCNDLQQNWRKLWIATAGYVGTALIIYLTNVDPRQPAEPELFLALFPMALLGGGLVFTSTIFSDMHHPLQRFHYLTLPCSNPERFLSRYLLTAPLFYLYVLVLYWIFDHAAAALSQAMSESRAAEFLPSHELVVWVSLGFFFFHSVMFIGAVYFRSYHLIKSVLAGVLFCVGLGVVQILSVKIFFWDFFPSILSFNDNVPIQPLFMGRDDLLISFLFLLHVWLLYVAYRCLCDHEVQDEL